MPRRRNVNPGDEDLARAVREGMDRACRDFTARVEPLGFLRARKRTWVRPRPLTAEVVYFHRQGSSYGVASNASVEIRIELSLRILNDPAPERGLIGPRSDPGNVRGGRYHLRFNARSGSTYERCIDDLVRFLEDVGGPWFRTYASGENLLKLPDAELPPATKALLEEALSGRARQENVAETLRGLGLQKA